MINPDLWKEFLQTASRIPSKKIRNFAFGSVVFGLLIVWNCNVFLKGILMSVWLCQKISLICCRESPSYRNAQAEFSQSGSFAWF